VTFSLLNDVNTVEYVTTRRCHESVQSSDAEATTRRVKAKKLTLIRSLFSAFLRKNAGRTEGAMAASHSATATFR